MMMRVDDGQGRLEDLFLPLRQPRFIHHTREMVFGRRHDSSSSTVTISNAPTNAPRRQ